MMNFSFDNSCHSKEGRKKIKVPLEKMTDENTIFVEFSLKKEVIIFCRTAKFSQKGYSALMRSLLSIASLVIVSSVFAGSYVAQGRLLPTSATSSSSLSSAVSLHSSLALSSHSAVASSAAPVTPHNVKIPILVYHHVRPTKGYPTSTWSYKMSVSPDIFAKQMQWIVDHGYTTVDLTTASQILTGKLQGPAKPMVITFDDNNPEQYTVALPILLKDHLMAVFFLITNRLNNKSFITADKVKEMSADGMDIESHTVTHRVLTLLPTSELDKELVDSKKALEAIINKPVLHIAYPGTADNNTVRARVAAAGYITGEIMDPRVATQKDDLLKLPRIEMLDTTNMQKILP